MVDLRLVGVTFRRVPVSQLVARLLPAGLEPATIGLEGRKFPDLAV